MTDQQRRSPVALCWMAPTLHCQKSKTCLQETVREAGHADSVELARGRVLHAWVFGLVAVDMQKLPISLSSPWTMA